MTEAETEKMLDSFLDKMNASEFVRAMALKVSGNRAEYVQLVARVIKRLENEAQGEFALMVLGDITGKSRQELVHNIGGYDEDVLGMFNALGVTVDQYNEAARKYMMPSGEILPEVRERLNIPTFA